MTSKPALERSRALWNRSRLDLRSDEILAQLMDRGELDAWRALCQLARSDDALRRRMHQVVLRVPVALAHFWLAALASLGEPVDFDVDLPEDPGT